MAAVDELLTFPADTSASFTPTEKVSDAIIEAPGGAGKMQLQCQSPTSGTWVTITERTGAFSFITSDVALIYRVVMSKGTQNARIYLGP